MDDKQTAQQTSFDVQPGDIWQCGRHRIMCGDATSKEDVKRLFDGRHPTLVVTSPPYAKQRDYDRPIACWDSMMIQTFCSHDLSEDVQLLINLGVIHQKNEWWPYWWTWAQCMRKRGWRLYSNYVWNKMGSFPGNMHGRLRPSHESILHLNKKTVQANAWVRNKWFGRANKVGPCASGLKQKNNLSLKQPSKGVREFSEPLSVISIHNIKSNHESTGHPAQMPTALAAFLLRTWKKNNSIAYDPFVGSGTTVQAAEQEDVTGLGMEIAPAYVAIALERWTKAYPDQHPVKIITGASAHV